MIKPEVNISSKSLSLEFLLKKKIAQSRLIKIITITNMIK